jgi:ABC-type sulfate/molybdate transport systems ATPase subunit
MASEETLSFDLRVEGEHGHRRLSLSLALPSGVTVLLGPSGAGKSTCLLALAGLVRPHAGRITLAGRTLFDAARGIDIPPWRRRVALVFQDLALFPHLSALENVCFGIDGPRAARRVIASQWLARMQVSQVAERKPPTLSGGEAQRVALARALASTPSLLLLDEPFSALDPVLRAELVEAVRTVVRELAIPALLVTHQQEDAAALGERVVRLRAGELDSRAY